MTGSFWTALAFLVICILVGGTALALLFRHDDLLDPVDVDELDRRDRITRAIGGDS